jgi:hypothetical protein
MRNNRRNIWFVLAALYLTGFTCELKSQSTEGEMGFSVQTVTANGNFSPKHVLVIWVEDAEGFVLTRKLAGDKRKEYLYTWNTNSGGNVIDASTGETLLEHQTHTITWDCRDTNGNLVPDGTYMVYVEFTDAHAQGPLITVPFTKGTEALSLTPADETNFKNMTLSFVPDVATGNISLSKLVNSSTDKLQIYPNPSHGMVFIRLHGPGGIHTLKVLSMNGSLISSMVVDAPGTYQIDLADFEQGSYLIQVDSNQESTSQIIIKQ